MRYYKPSRMRRQSPPAPTGGFSALLPDSALDLFAADAPDPTHLVPTTGHARFRQSACGVACAEGRLTHERETHGLGSSTLANVDCAECLRLSDLDEPTASAERDDREAPTCKCGAPVYAEGLCVAHHEKRFEESNRALPRGEQRD
jgi:hypothetical protein